MESVRGRPRSPPPDELLHGQHQGHRITSKNLRFMEQAAVVF
jgi:hypothetical protein